MLASALHLLFAASLVTSLPVFEVALGNETVSSNITGFSNETLEKVQANLLQIATHRSVSPLLLQV